MGGRREIFMRSVGARSAIPDRKKIATAPNPERNDFALVVAAKAILQASVSWFALGRVARAQRLRLQGCEVA